MRALVRAGHPGPSLVVGAAAAGLAAASGRRAASCAGAGLVVLTGHLSIGWHNDWVDAPHDAAAGRPEKPIVAGEINRSLVGAAAVASLAATAPLSAVSGRRAAAAHLGAVGLGWAYNAGLKGTAFSVGPFLLAYPLIVSFATLGGSAGRWPRPSTLACTALLTSGAHLLNGEPDIEADDRSGLRGMPQRLGRSRSQGIGALLVLIATGGVVLEGGGRAGRAVLAAAASTLALGGALASRRPGSRALFHASLGVALLDVLLLLRRGGGL